MNYIFSLKEFHLSVEQYQLFFGINDANLKVLEKQFDCIIKTSPDLLIITLKQENNSMFEVLQEMIKIVLENEIINEEVILQIVKSVINKEEKFDKNIKFATTSNGKVIKPKNATQAKYHFLLENNTIVFATGAAGTGKTYLAVAYATYMLKSKKVNKIIITRPIVEAGENLGFLPGEIKEKVDPYLTPIYDALFDMLGKETTEKYIDKGIIEIAPLAYMRGRTLDDAMIILDEAQNTTSIQMKMFLTRLGYNSKMIITGDQSQIDLKDFSKSGIIIATKLLNNIDGIAEIVFDSKDVVRHPLVSKIIDAYEKYENNRN